MPTRIKMRVIAPVLVSLGVLLSGTPGEAQEPAAVQQAAPVGEVAALRGAASVIRPTGVLELGVGTPILANDRIRTGAEDRVKIRFVDGTMVAIGSSSEFVVSEFRVGADNVRRQGILSAISGLFRATVTPGLPEASFRIETPTAIASVRSTDWLGEVSPASTGILVVEGSVVVSGRQPTGTAVLLQPGEGTDVPAGGVPTPPVRWGAARASTLLGATEIP